jgi:four helix bundle protein
MGDGGGAAAFSRRPATVRCRTIAAAAQIDRVAADFVDLLAWQEGVALVRDVVRLAPQVRGAGAEEVVDQMLRAAESVPADVAEGYGRGLGRDFAKFLRTAAASAAEVESHVRLAEASGRLRAEVALELVRRARRVRALVVGLRRSVRVRRPDGAGPPNAPGASRRIDPANPRP